MTISDEDAALLEELDLKVREAKAQYDHVRLLRDREIRRVAAEGGTYREIAERAGVVYQRVAKLVTGKPPKMREQNDELLFACPHCGAEPGDPCEGKSLYRHHIQRSHEAIRAFEARNPEQG
jgi:hypothetical protein